MPTIIQLYIFATIGYIILSRPLNDLLSDKLFRWVSLLLVYVGVLRIVLGFYPELPTFFHESIFLVYTLFVPGAFLCLRNSVNGSQLKEKDWAHVLPFIMLLVCTITVTFSSTGFIPELKKIWSLNYRSSYDPNVLMPLFLFVYCFTAFYFYHVLLLFRNKLFKKDDTVPENHNMNEALVINFQSKEESQHQPLVISQERMVEIDNIVNEVLAEKKPYLQQRYSLKDLSIDTSIPLHHLSAFINKYKGKNFNDFINEFRVHHCKDKILKEEYKFKKLEAIAEESGFNNRNTFAIAFKKVLGLKPSEYLRNLKSLNQDVKHSYENNHLQEISTNSLTVV